VRYYEEEFTDSIRAMKNAHDVGRYFWQPVKLKRWSAVLRKAQTQETETPFRTAHSYAVHLFGVSWGLVVGRWQSTGYDAEDAADAVDIIIGLRKAEEFDTSDMEQWIANDPLVKEIINGRVLF
jgi:hypothetical protein